MFCTNCGCEVSDRATFCTNCGTRLKLKESEAQPAVQAAEEIASVITSIPTPEPQTVSAAPTVEEPATPVNQPEEPIAEEPIAEEPPVAPVTALEESAVPVAPPVPEEPAVPVAPPVPTQPVAPVIPPVSAKPVAPATPSVSTPVVAQPEKPVPAATPVRPAYAPIPTAVQMPVKPQTQPTTVQIPQTPTEKPVSTWLYVLMLFLSFIPVVGLIVHIICLAAAKQKSFRNYCRAVVILGVISLVLLIAALVAGFIFLDRINEFLSAYNILIESLI